MHIKGWAEIRGEVLLPDRIKTILSSEPEKVAEFGGEFYLEWKECRARDKYGVIQGPCPAGKIICNTEKRADISPDIPDMELGKAILTAVRLRSDEGVTALSGGVDSALVAKLADRPCIAVGINDTHDLTHAAKVAKLFGLKLQQRIITPCEIEDVLPLITSMDENWTPVDIAIATTLFFVAETAAENGYERILTGQSADEIFGGYSRYLKTDTLEQDLKKDFVDLARQAARDQKIAEYHNTYLSMPYLDGRVVCAASKIPASKKVRDGIRKRPLREVAARHMPEEIAYYEKKAMQYGTGIWKEIRRLARHNGYNKSVQEYLNSLRKG